MKYRVMLLVLLVTIFTVLCCCVPCSQPESPPGKYEIKFGRDYYYTDSFIIENGFIRLYGYCTEYDSRTKRFGVLRCFDKELLLPTNIPEIPVIITER